MINTKINGRLAFQSVPAEFINLPGAANVMNLPDIQAFDEKIDEKSFKKVSSLCRWEGEGGKYK